MKKDYVKLVESCLNEQKICKSSELYKKFIKLVQDYFVPRAKNGEVILANSIDEPLTSNDIQLFCKYNLLTKQDEKIKMTKKGMMLATDKEIEVNVEPTDEEFGKHIEDVKNTVKGLGDKDDDIKSRYGYVLTVYANGRTESSHEDEWRKRMKQKKQLLRKHNKND